MDIHAGLLLGHLIGTVLGVGGATYIEIHLNSALKDGTMDNFEKSNLGKDFIITRIGMILCLVTGIGFVVEYAMKDQVFRIQDGVFWAKMLAFIIIVINAYLLHKHKIGLYWGSAFSFVSWWSVMILGFMFSNSMKVFPGQPIYGFLAVMIVYGVLVTVGAYILHTLRQSHSVKP